MPSNESGMKTTLFIVGLLQSLLYKIYYEICVLLSDSEIDILS